MNDDLFIRIWNAAWAVLVFALYFSYLRIQKLKTLLDEKNHTIDMLRAGTHHEDD